MACQLNLNFSQKQKNFENVISGHYHSEIIRHQEPSSNLRSTFRVSAGINSLCHY